MVRHPDRVRRLVSVAAVLSLGLTPTTGCQKAPERTASFETRTSAESVSPPASTARTPSTAAADNVTVPDVTGMRLTDGEATLRAMGFLSIQVVDATGQNRSVLEHNNWVVQNQDPRPGTPSEPGTVITLGVRKPTDTLPSEASVKGLVPNVECRDLQTAQDMLRSAGYYILIPKDGLGQGRFPLLDRNWIVVGQSAPPGSHLEWSAQIELTVVKYGERRRSRPCARVACSASSALGDRWP
jgi:hypothetical protein